MLHIVPPDQEELAAAFQRRALNKGKPPGARRKKASCIALSLSLIQVESGAGRRQCEKQDCDNEEAREAHLIPLFVKPRARQARPM